MTTRQTAAKRAAAARALRHFNTYGYGMLAALMLFGVTQLSIELPEPWETVTKALLTIAIYVVGLLSVATTRLRLIIGITLCCVALFDDAIGVLTMGSVASASGAELSMILLAYLSYCLTADMLTRRGSVRTQLLAAVCLYIILAIMFSRAYLLINDAFDGKAFAGTMTGPFPDRFSPDDALYYSFVTQTTVGFGDITPIARPARALSVVHATIGVLYIAVVVSAVTSSRQASEKKSPHDPSAS